MRSVDINTYRKYTYNVRRSCAKDRQGIGTDHYGRRLDL